MRKAPLWGLVVLNIGAYAEHPSLLLVLRLSTYRVNIQCKCGLGSHNYTSRGLYVSEIKSRSDE